MENQNFQLEDFERSGVGSGKPAVVGDIPKMEQKMENNSEDEQCEEKNDDSTEDNGKNNAEDKKDVSLPPVGVFEVVSILSHFYLLE